MNAADAVKSIKPVEPTLHGTVAPTPSSALPFDLLLHVKVAAREPRPNRPEAQADRRAGAPLQTPKLREDRWLTEGDPPVSDPLPTTSHGPAPDEREDAVQESITAAAGATPPPAIDDSPPEAAEPAANEPGSTIAALVPEIESTANSPVGAESTSASADLWQSSAPALPTESGSADETAAQIATDSSAVATSPDDGSEYGTSGAVEDLVSRVAVPDASQNADQVQQTAVDVAANGQAQESGLVASLEAIESSSRQSQRRHEPTSGHDPSVPAQHVPSAIDPAGQIFSAAAGSPAQLIPAAPAPAQTAPSPRDDSSSAIAPQPPPARTLPRLLARTDEEGARALRPVEIDSARLLNRVARAFQAAQQRGGGLKLRLSPPELGSLRLELRVEDGVMTARLETETHAARAALVENLPALRERLAEQGIRIERFDVDLMQQQGQGQGHGQGTPDRPGSSELAGSGFQVDRETRDAKSETDAPQPRCNEWNSPTGLNVIV